MSNANFAEFQIARTDEMVAWLREQVKAERAEWEPLLRGTRRNGKATARAALSRCEAHLELIDWAWKYNGPHMFTEAPHVLRLLALAYRHRPGYQEGWKP